MKNPSKIDTIEKAQENISDEVKQEDKAVKIQLFNVLKEFEHDLYKSPESERAHKIKQAFTPAPRVDVS